MDDPAESVRFLWNKTNGILVSDNNIKKYI